MIKAKRFVTEILTHENVTCQFLRPMMCEPLSLLGVFGKLYACYGFFILEMIVLIGVVYLNISSI